jgi:hypothetical protein
MGMSVDDAVYGFTSKRFSEFNGCVRTTAIY